jgi:hypothetical protein
MVRNGTVWTPSTIRSGRVWMTYGRIMTEDRVPQRRHLVTEIPGPASRALLARRERVVARGTPAAA